MDQEFNKLYNMARGFLIFAAVVAMSIVLSVAYRKIAPADASVFLAAISLIISTGSFLFIVLNTERQKIEVKNNAQTKREDNLMKKSSKR